MDRKRGFAESIEQIRKHLGLSYEQVAEKLDLSVEYVIRVHSGLPFPEVEERITDTYLKELGRKLASIKGLENRGASILSEIFVRLVREFKMSLSDAITLFEKALDTDPALVERRFGTAVELGFWESVLEGIIKDLIGEQAESQKEIQVAFPELDSEYYSHHNFNTSTWEDALSEIESNNSKEQEAKNTHDESERLNSNNKDYQLGQKFHAKSSVMILDCPVCPEIYVNPQNGRCVRCGATLVHPNWNPG